MKTMGASSYRRSRHCPPMGTRQEVTKLLALGEFRCHVPSPHDDRESRSGVNAVPRPLDGFTDGASIVLSTPSTSRFRPFHPSRRCSGAATVWV